LTVGRHVPKLADQPQGCKLRSAIKTLSIRANFATAYEFVSGALRIPLLRCEHAPGFTKLGRRK